MDTYELRDIYLTFYHGSLTECYVKKSDPRLDNLFKSKYGDPRTEPMHLLTPCYKKEKSFELKDDTNLFVWSDFENDITILSGITHDVGTCEPKEINTLTLKNNNNTFKALKMNREAERLMKSN